MSVFLKVTIAVFALLQVYLFVQNIGKVCGHVEPGDGLDTATGRLGILISAVALFVGTMWIFWEAWPR